MTQYSGVLKMVRFNWPCYAATAAATAAALVLLMSGSLHSPWTGPIITAFLISNFWMVASLCASHYVYDCSPISRGAWLEVVNPSAVRKVAVFHAGQDEAVQRTPLSRLVLIGFASFWGSRLVFQWLVFDLRLWRGNSLNTFVHVLFTVMWMYLTSVYAVALLFQD